MLGLCLTDATQSVQITGNTIFNWDDQVPMKTGIQENSSCCNNQLTCSNINFYTDMDVVSEGLGTSLSHTISELEKTYVQPSGTALDFNRDRFEHFIDELRKSR